MISAIALPGVGRPGWGTDKRLVPLHGRPILSRTLDTVKPLTDDIVVAVGGGVPEVGAPRIVRDDLRGRGSRAGILAGLHRTQTQYALVVPVDMPLLSMAFLAYLCRESPGWAVTVPRWSAGIEPLVGVYSARCVGPLERYLAGSPASARDFIRSMEPAVRYVEEAEIRDVEDPAVLFFNINAPADVQHAACLLQRREATVASSPARPGDPTA